MEQNQNNRPKKVDMAVKLLYASLGLGVLRSILEAKILAQMPSLTLVIAVTLVTLAILGFLIYKIGCGRNWARITFLVLFLLGLPLTVHALYNSLSRNLASTLLGICQFLVQLVALVYLFQKDARVWFKKSA